MNLQRCLVFASAFVCAAGLWQGVVAQSHSTVVADPKAAVPGVVYRSVFAQTPSGVERDRLDWRNANESVARFKRGHVDILKQEEADSRTTDKPMPAAVHKH
jgi:hypothetical protein